MLLKAEAVSKSFAQKAVLRSVTLQVDRGERIGLVGRNGVGKTTVLKVIMGLIGPDTGEIALRTDKIGYLSQDPMIDPKRSVGETVGRPYGHLAVLAMKIAELEKVMAREPSRAMEVGKEYARLQERYATEGGYEVSSKAEDALRKVGLPKDIVTRNISELSGGETTKVMLARVLVQANDADLLFLDEPTSHLDVETVEWLEEHLKKIDCGLVVVSHDRYFLDNVVNKISELDEGTLHNYTGNYSDFIEKKAIEIEQRLRAYEKDKAKRDRLLSIAKEQKRRWTYFSLHKTRLKMLERMDTVDAPKQDRDLLVKIDTATKAGKNVIMAKDIRVRRDGRTIVENVDLDLEVGDKLGIFGPNGSGKTTLLKAFLSEIPYEGDLWIAPGAKIGYFAQGHDTLNGTLTPEEQLLKALGRSAKQKARKMLALFLLSGRDVERPISTLSGGERARVALAMMMAEQRNFLIMDEPTNYLDIPARHAVESALVDYPGTLLVVTHDRYFLDSVCNKVGELKDQGLVVFGGTYSQMKEAGRVKGDREHTYKVVSGFKDWTTGKKYKVDDTVVIPQGEMERFKWALESGKLRMIGDGKKRR